MTGKGKKYYKIGEVSNLVGVDTHILRYWESVFPTIKPRRVSKQRLYRCSDLKTILTIKKLLYEEGYTVAGAKKKMSVKAPNANSKNSNFPISKNCEETINQIMEVRAELIEIIESLQS